MLVDLKLAIKRLKEGKEGKPAGKELASSEGLNDQGEPRKLMLIESDVKMQDMLRDLFKKNGYRVLVLGDPERAVERFFEDPRTADVILFTTSSNGRAALDAFNRFGQEGIAPRHPRRTLARPKPRPLGRRSPSRRAPRRRKNADQDARPPRCTSRSDAEKSLLTCILYKAATVGRGSRRTARFMVADKSAGSLQQEGRQKSQVPNKPAPVRWNPRRRFPMPH